jgi:hypothetical protein
MPPVVVPLLEAPVVPEVAEGPPAFELPPAVPLALCARTRLDVNARVIAVTKANSFIVYSSG